MRKAVSTADLLASIRDVVRQSRKAVAYGVNTAMVLTNYEIGRLIVEHEQKGAARAEYAEETLKALGRRLTAEFGKGYSTSNLACMRKFYLLLGKVQTLSGQSDKQADLALALRIQGLTAYDCATEKRQVDAEGRRGSGEMSIWADMTRCSGEYDAGQTKPLNTKRDF